MACSRTQLALGQYRNCSFWNHNHRNHARMVAGLPRSELGALQGFERYANVAAGLAIAMGGTAIQVLGI